jgi:hypothetical protein
VFTKQPWVVSSDTLLFELENKDKKEITEDSYIFEYIYVTVRAYGIPKENRSLKLLKDILNLVGTQSQFHELRQIMIEARPDYIWGITRIRVGAPVIDRVKLRDSSQEIGITYLHYEKIGRICLFCGVMFHTIGNCYLRQQIVTEKIQCGKFTEAQEIPFQRFGSWIIDVTEIPKSFAVQGEGSNPVFSTFQNPHLSRFQRAFEGTQGRRGTTEAPNQMLQIRDNHQK